MATLAAFVTQYIAPAAMVAAQIALLIAFYLLCCWLTGNVGESDE